MRMSCNGCRVLRKGCSVDCTLKPCLQWIKSPDSQANATLFLAKFYGRAGLINLINAGPHHLRPAIFRSLLYEACGRIINPIYGSVGLVWSADWTRCQEAVEAVLKGAPITKIIGDDKNAAPEHQQIAPLQGCDIRHLSKESAAAHRLRTRHRFKRPASSSSSSAPAHAKTPLQLDEFMDEPAGGSAGKFTITGWVSGEDQLKRASSNDSSSVESAEPSPGNSAEPVSDSAGRFETGLELTLGLNPVHQACLSTVIEISDNEM